MSTDVIYFEDLLIDYLNDVLAKTEKVSPDEYDDMWLDLFSKTKEFIKKADESYLKDNDKVRQEVEALVNIFNDKTLMFPDLVKKALNYITETKQSCFPEKNTVQRFKDLAKQYGFKVVKDGEAYRLCAKNTDHRWTRWISYYPEKDTVSAYGNTDHLNIWLCETRKEFTPEICLKFVEDLNNLFELKGENKFFIKELIDPEDWQEIAGVHDAYEDKRYYLDATVETVKDGRFPKGAVFYVNGDSCDMGIEDYNVRVSAYAEVIEQPNQTDKKVLVCLDNIDGDCNVNIYINKKTLKEHNLQKALSGEDTMRNEKKYFEASLVNYDENNVPYNVETVYFSAFEQIEKEVITEFCHEDLGLDFEEVFSVEEIPHDEVLEYVKDEEVPFLNVSNSLEKAINKAKDICDAGNKDEVDKSEIDLEI